MSSPIWFLKSPRVSSQHTPIFMTWEMDIILPWRIYRYTGTMKIFVLAYMNKKSERGRIIQYFHVDIRLYKTQLTMLCYAMNIYNLWFVIFAAWQLLFKASSHYPVDRPWHEYWIDESFVNDDDAAALITQPGPVFKAQEAIKWGDNSKFNQVRPAWIITPNWEM